MTMTSRFSPLLVALICVLLACSWKVDAFAGQQSMVQPFVSRSSSTKTMKHTNTRSVSATSLNAFPVDPTMTASISSSDMLLSATTLDPTTFFQNFLSLFLNTPIILAVPIVAALGVAGTLAWLIVSYANPQEDN